MEKREITERAREIARYIGYTPTDVAYDLALERIQTDLDTAKLARRERIATAVLGGMAAGAPEALSEETPAWKVAVIWADALIAELDKEAPSGKA